MPRTRLHWQLFGAWCALAAGVLAACHWLASVEMARLGEGVQTRRMLEAGRALVEVAPADPGGDPAAFLAAAREAGRIAGMSVDLLDVGGTVVAGTSVREGSAADGTPLDGASLAEAIAGRSATSGRYDAVAGRRTVAVSVPRVENGRTTSIVRLTADTSRADEDIAGGQRRLIAGGLAVALGALVAGWLVARRAARPIEDLATAAARVADGAVDLALPASDVIETSRLASSVDTLRGQLVERGLLIGRQGTQQEAVLASMMEGVLAVDARQRVVSINRAAADLLGVEPSAVLGRPLQEVVRNADLRQFAIEAIGRRDPVEDDLVLRAARDRTIRVRGTALCDASGEGGAVIVLEDITDIRHLENVRRDFVANVSHELKTPVASIKGFVETLLDGGVDDPDDRRRFLEIVGRQSDRLGSIIEDLLSLSRIEQTEESGDLPVDLVEVADIFAAVAAECGPRAAARSIEIAVDGVEGLAAEVNPPLLEQALINLVDNAVKYSDPGKRVALSAARSPDGAIEFSVRDEGSGIAPEHLPRIFERFYRVDKGRSRRMGGTGLGLAIVKHIVQAHGGSVSVESTPGVGSTFKIRIPPRGGRG